MTRFHTRREVALVQRRRVLISLLVVALPAGALFLARALAWARAQD